MAISKNRLVFGVVIPAFLVIGIIVLFWGIGAYEKNRRAERTQVHADRLAALQEEIGDEALDELRRIPVLYSDRLQPLDSMARHTVRDLSGEWSMYGADPVLIFLSMAFDGEDFGWNEIPMFLISFGKNRSLLNMDSAEKYATAEQLDAAPVRKYAMKNEEAYENKIDTMPRADLELRSRHFVTLRRFQQGFASSFLFVPPTRAQEISDDVDQDDWHLPGEARAYGHDPVAAQEMADSFEDLKSAWRERNSTKLIDATHRIEAAMHTMNPRADIPEDEVEAELGLNRTNPFNRSGWLYIAASLVALFAWAFRVPPLRWLAMALAIAGLALSAYGFYLRVVLGFGIAITNLYESMVAVSFTTMLLCVAVDLVRKSAWATIAGGLGAFVILQFLEMYTQKFDAKIGGTVAVLANNIWVHIHVPVVMAAYAGFFIAFMISCVTTIWTLFDPKAKNPDLNALLKTASVAMSLGTFLIFVGMILGGIWANESWGRFWGWDPKETWAFILFVYYLLIVHLRFSKRMSPFLFSLMLFFGGNVLLWAYYGTNELLSGLHSYAASAAEGSGFYENFISEKNRWFVYTTAGLTLFTFFAGFARFLTVQIGSAAIRPEKAD